MPNQINSFAKAVGSVFLEKKMCRHTTIERNALHATRCCNRLSERYWWMPVRGMLVDAGGCQMPGAEMLMSLCWAACCGMLGDAGGCWQRMPEARCYKVDARFWVDAKADADGCQRMPVGSGTSSREPT